MIQIPGIFHDYGKDPNTILLHATAVALNGRAVLFLGPSGSGKSELALQMMAFGCDLISDDRVLVAEHNGMIYARRPPEYPNLIEARGVGLLITSTIECARAELLVDLSNQNDVRAPLPDAHSFFDVGVALIPRTNSQYFPAMVLQMLKAGMSTASPKPV